MGVSHTDTPQSSLVRTEQVRPSVPTCLLHIKAWPRLLHRPPLAVARVVLFLFDLARSVAVRTLKLRLWKSKMQFDHTTCDLELQLQRQLQLRLWQVQQVQAAIRTTTVRICRSLQRSRDVELTGTANCCKAQTTQWITCAEQC